MRREHEGVLPEGLARTEHRDVARSGTAKVWVDDKGNVVKYAVTLKLQGRVGNAEIDGTATRTTTLSGAGGTKIEVPEAAKKRCRRRSGINPTGTSALPFLRSKEALATEVTEDTERTPVGLGALGDLGG